MHAKPTHTCNFILYVQAGCTFWKWYLWGSESLWKALEDKICVDTHIMVIGPWGQGKQVHVLLGSQGQGKWNQFFFFEASRLKEQQCVDTKNAFSLPKWSFCVKPCFGGSGCTSINLWWDCKKRGYLFLLVGWWCSFPSPDIESVQKPQSWAFVEKDLTVGRNFHFYKFVGLF